MSEHNRHFSIVSTYLKPEDKEKLVQLAKRDGVSVSKLLFPLVMSYIAANGDQAGKQP